MKSAATAFAGNYDRATHNECMSSLRQMDVRRAFPPRSGGPKPNKSNHTYPLPPKMPSFADAFPFGGIDKGCRIKHLPDKIEARTIIQMVIKDP